MRSRSGFDGCHGVFCCWKLEVKFQGGRDWGGGGSGRQYIGFSWPNGGVGPKVGVSEYVSKLVSWLVGWLVARSGSGLVLPSKTLGLITHFVFPAPTQQQQQQQ